MFAKLSFGLFLLVTCHLSLVTAQEIQLGPPLKTTPVYKLANPMLRFTPAPSSQTGNETEWRNPAKTLVTWVDKDGVFHSTVAPVVPPSMVTFDQIGSGTNTTAAMRIGAGASLGPSGAALLGANTFCISLDCGGSPPVSGHLLSIGASHGFLGSDAYGFADSGIAASSLSSVISNAPYVRLNPTADQTIAGTFALRLPNGTFSMGSCSTTGLCIATVDPTLANPIYFSPFAVLSADMPANDYASISFQPEVNGSGGAHTLGNHESLLLESGSASGTPINILGADVGLKVHMNAGPGWTVNGDEIAFLARMDNVPTTGRRVAFQGGPGNGPRDYVFFGTGQGDITGDFAGKRIKLTHATALSSGNFALTGWGTGATIACTSGQCTDQSFHVTITAGTGPSVNPVAILTYADGDWGNAPNQLCVQTGGNDVIADVTVCSGAFGCQVGAPAGTLIGFQWLGTPTAGSTYTITCTGFGS